MLNNPVRYNDPTGHIIPILIVVGIGLLSGVAIDTGIDFVTDNQNFDLGTSVSNSLKDPLTWVGAIPFGKLAKLGKVSKVAKFMGAACSFSEDTEVATIEGETAISSLEVGDLVLAYDEQTGTTGYYPVVAVLVHDDPVIEYLTIDGERLETTPEHPFYTAEQEWVPAGDLSIGNRIWKADGSLGVVQFLEVVSRHQVMYNLTVDGAHTFYVGDGQWLVHNECNAAKVPRLWSITAKATDRVVVHRTFGTISSHASSGLWWSRDLAGHGNSVWKVFEETPTGLRWIADADEYGDFIIKKYKGPVGQFIPWSELRGVNR